MGFLTLIFNIGYNGASVGSNIWLAKWSTDEDNGPGNMTHSTLVCHSVNDFIHSSCAHTLWGVERYIITFLLCEVLFCVCLASM